jgi:hypothetical protein
MVASKEAWFAVAGSARIAVEFEDNILLLDSIPAFAKAVRAGEPPTPAYWAWLAENFELMQRAWGSGQIKLDPSDSAPHSI